MQRRHFIGVSSWAALQGILRAAPAAGDEAYWSLVKRQFPLEPGLLYFNAANVCPASHAVLDRYTQYERDFQSDPAFQNRDKYGPIRTSARAKVARLLNVTPAEIAFTRNTSESNCTIVHGLDLKPGDEILAADHNHQSNLISWQIRAKRQGLVVNALPTPAPAPSRDALISMFERAITPKTRVITITHVTNVSGLKFPAKEIAELGRRRGLWVHLDGAQSFGAMDVDLKDIGCDSYSASTHKWLMGPLEAGILYVRAERVGEVWPSIVTAGWSDQVTDARKLENYGQQDDPRIAGLDAALDFTNLVGIKTIEARVRWLASYFKEQAKAIRGVELKTNLEADLSHGVVKLSTGEANVKKHYDTLWERNRLSIASTPHGNQHGLRFSAHIYNTKDDVDRAVKALKDVVG
jgi:selenocysteine lyase/cysteine desulfurase